MLDCLSGGRLVAGLPLGLSYDTNLNYGVPPVQSRARFREAHDLIRKAWSASEPFAWNGKFWQFREVNPWPRPIQQPRPPVWIPGTGTPGTINWVLDNDYGYCHLSWFGARLAGKAVVDRYWDVVAQRGRPANPYGLAFLQNVVVAETDAQAERDYARHVEFFFQKCIAGIPPHWMALPGYVDYAGLEHLFRNPGELEAMGRLGQMSFRELAEAQCVVAGSPATVRQQLQEIARDLRIGNMIVMLQMGSMPHELVMKNIDLFAREVLPAVHGLWDDQGWEHAWWPQALGGGRPAAEPAVA
jgi:alkanesulfonate monooxygenase SsuD/methylene tetrahydromethanopterin reductase-like flavin-dependent oxidoreductase (luciferase family)